MNELQTVEFELLKSFIGLCETLDLTYYLVCGTALGAVKYNGFIPWDDDVDVAMPREAYEVFIREAPRLLDAPYFLQNYHSDPKFPACYTKIRNSSTTYIEKSSSHFDVNHGIYIDIFPLDEYPCDSREQRKLERKKWIISRQLSCGFDMKRGLAARIMQRINLMLGYGNRTARTAQKLEKALTQYKGESSDLICNHGNWQGKLEYAPKEQYGEGTWMTFEGLRVRIPVKYDEYLTQKYGDWRADLPTDQQVGHHYYEVLDLNRPYTDYVERLPNGRIRIKKHNT